MERGRVARLVMATFALALAARGDVACVVAGEYPMRPIRLVVPFPPGGGNDVIGRLMATSLGERLGKQVVVDNRGGAAGVIGAEIAARSPPDGYTLLLVSLAHCINPWLFKLTYDPVKDFTAVGLFARGPNVLVAHPSLPVHSVQDLIALAKKHPGELQYASAGVGSFQQLGGELFKLMAGVDILHVPFKGGGPAMVDILGGHTKLMFSSMVQAVPQIRAGKLRALGTGGSTRSPILSDIPTISEAGVPGYQAVNWWGVFAPAGTAKGIVDRLNSEIRTAENSPDVQKHLALGGAETAAMSPTEFGGYFVSEMAKWKVIVKESGIKSE